ncbi:small ubiquitin-related modifier [Lentinula raphanica]|uniref:Small ubiquitin-related modifier n=1 Tax=Lentinula raphanica TaxID=153919 RepID=A0AA38PFZ3_9AGAR|nr:small ubiquitin-related modifier [Lentinula raphanica]
MSEEQQVPFTSQQDMNQQDDTKTGDPETINVKVVSSSGDEVFFKIKRTTQLRKLLGAYANKVGKDVNTIRFLYDGTRISETDTPHSLEMEDNDTIDVMVEQVGGYSS